MAAANGTLFADEGALQTLVIGSRGLPELIARVCVVGTSSTKITSKQIREILDINWGAPILRFWLTLITNEQPDAQLPLPGPLQLEKAATHSRFVLSELLGILRTGAVGGSGEPALRLADEALLHDVLRALRQKAEIARLRPESLIAHLAETIRQDDFTGEGSFVEFERAIRAKLR